MHCHMWYKYLTSFQSIFSAYWELLWFFTAHTLSHAQRYHFNKYVVWEGFYAITHFLINIYYISIVLSWILVFHLMYRPVFEIHKYIRLWWHIVELRTRWLSKNWAMAKKQKYFEPDSGLMFYTVVNVVNDSLWFQYRLSSPT